MTQQNDAFSAFGLRTRTMGAKKRSKKSRKGGNSSAADPKEREAKELEELVDNAAQCLDQFEPEQAATHLEQALQKALSLQREPQFCRNVMEMLAEAYMGCEEDEKAMAVSASAIFPL